MTQKKVLIVDDEQHMRTSLRLIVQRLGHAPHCAQNGYEALNVLIDGQSKGIYYDLMLCDLQMPHISGEELIGEMKRRKIQTPVLVITGVGDKAGVVRLMRLGCRDFIDKPFSPDEIENRITSLLDALSSEVAENTRKEYMARLGEKARSSAHDINNVLAGTMGYADLALEEIEEGHQTRTYLNKILKTTSRAAEICQTLLNASRCNEPPEFVPTEINSLIVRCAALLEDVVAAYVSIETKTDAVPLWCTVNAERIQQAVLNLGINAAQAMEKGGRLTIACSPVEHVGGASVCLTISDTGAGIAPDILGKLFQKEFTTKINGHGIGLQTVKEIVEEHTGTIAVNSIVGNGTTFTINIPCNGPDRTKEKGAKS